MNPQPPQSPQPNPEAAGGTSPENVTMPGVDAAPAPATSAPASVPPKLSATDVAAAIAAMPTPTAPVTAPLPVPTSAADEDLIEPEWVNKTEEIITQNSGNPYAEEEAIEDLQIDYLNKRYGHQVKKPEDK